jgi:hypothetical protein
MNQREIYVLGEDTNKGNECCLMMSVNDGLVVKSVEDKQINQRILDNRRIKINEI